MYIVECGVVVVGVVNVVGHDVGGGVGVMAIWIGEIWGVGGVVLVVLPMSMRGVGVDSVGGVVVYVLPRFLVPSKFPVQLRLSFYPTICYFPLVTCCLLGF